ncbi:Acyl-CoA dehydrogenase, C-terminal domain [Cellulosimicrobium cellulans]|nr:acyl-CoA dehydrogenase [Sphaerisporangium cinnabarinum]PTU55162.1 acyl-CoA dehydrogenase [Sphaerisporangium cinnabarinum]SDF28078.1 Acyl-CoA dehydrogenase, C-terminal domain [Cellulosimicrobium cellulans]
MPDLARPTTPGLVPLYLGPPSTPLADRPALVGPDELAAIDAAGTDVTALLDHARTIGARAPFPGDGRTAELWGALASLAATDVGAARVVEPHLDALAILGQVPVPVALDAVGAGPDSTWGVYAAEGPGVRLEAHERDGAWVLSGTKPWCSLAADLSHALVTAWTDAGRRLFAVALRAPGVVPADGPWVARGLAQVVSAAVRFDDVPAVPVGAPGWYLERPGFAWGGIGVAACWWGGAVGLARTQRDALAAREPDQLALAHLGATDRALAAGRAVLAEAASAVDAGVDGPDASLLARRVRGVVAEVVEEVQRRCAHALGPGPLTTDERFARRVADLGLYVRQHHAERDDASLGRALLAHGTTAW